MKETYKFFAIFLLAISFLMVGPFSVSAEENVDELKKQIQALQERIDRLESENERQPSAPDPYSFFNAGRSAWNPFAEMERMQQEMDRMFQHSIINSGEDNNPGIFSSNMNFNYDMDIQEDEKEYNIILDMSGLDQDKLEVQINDQSITVKGEQSVEERREGQAGFVQSRSFGLFTKTIPLPVDADTSKVKTEKKEKQLIITLPKRST